MQNGCKAARTCYMHTHEHIIYFTAGLKYNKAPQFRVSNHCRANKNNLETINNPFFSFSVLLHFLPQVCWFSLNNFVRKREKKKNPTDSGLLFQSWFLKKKISPPSTSVSVSVSVSLWFLPSCLPLACLWRWPSHWVKGKMSSARGQAVMVQVRQRGERRADSSDARMRAYGYVNWGKLGGCAQVALSAAPKRWCLRNDRRW